MGEARRRKLIDPKYGKVRQSREREGLYPRSHPLFKVMHPIWSNTCKVGFARSGRGALIRNCNENKMGQAGYFSVDKITDPQAQKLIASYDPSTEFVLGESTDVGTRWWLMRHA